MSTYTRVAAVTGSNKGIGLGCVRTLALQYPKSSLNNGPFLIYLTARNQERGLAALNSLQEDKQLGDAKVLHRHGGPVDIKYLPLDISNDQSIHDFTTTIKTQHPEGIDILINNAGIALDGFNSDLVKQTLACNYYGTLSTTQQLLPHMRDGGRIVNIASAVGHLNDKYSRPIRDQFLQATQTSQITQLMERFVQAVETNTHESDWPTSAYAVSKAGLIGATKIIASDASKSGSKVLINACCPGYVNTDMTKGRGIRTIGQGVRTPVLLALGDINGVTGQFWKDEKPVDWDTSREYSPL